MASPPGAFIIIPQWAGNPPSQPLVVPAANNHHLQSCQILKKGQAKALGATQLVLALLHISLGTVGIFVDVFVSRYSGICFWGAIFYIISGSLSIAVENNPYHSLIKGFLTMNIFSCVVSTIALALFLTDASISGYRPYSYNYGGYSDYSGYPGYMRYSAGIAVIAFLIISTLLQFCVCLALSIFGCKYMSHRSSATEQVFMLPNNQMSPGVHMNPNLCHVPLNTTGFGVSMMSEPAPAYAPPTGMASEPEPTKYN
uniref:Uncharacterized protein n=1 Tax=Leptobrachium leishanense TaxID=445787 RepID=A0A8C5QNH2_9ANUR